VRSAAATTAAAHGKKLRSVICRRKRQKGPALTELANRARRSLFRRDRSRFWAEKRRRRGSWPSSPSETGGIASAASATVAAYQCCSCFSLCGLDKRDVGLFTPPPLQRYDAYLHDPTLLLDEELRSMTEWGGKKKLSDGF